jgi:hypothetical protein
MKGFFGAAVFALILTAYAPAHATVLNGTITYYAVAEHGDPDFGNGAFCCSGHYTDEVKSTLGPNGLPVYSGNGYGGGAPNLSDVNPGTQELTWWSSVSTGSAAFSTPYDQHLFTPNGAGTDNNTSFQTAILTASLAGHTTYTFTYSGDDDVILAVGNNVISQDGGVHPFGEFFSVSVTTTGPDQLKVFFADRFNVQSELSLSVSAVPEPSTWAMLVLGFAGVGFLAYRRKPKAAFRLA